MDNVLIDSDVILDFYFDRKPFSEDATHLLSLCETKKIKGFTTPVIISNVYYLLKRDSPHAKIIEKLKQLLSIIDIIAINKSAVLSALNSNFKDFEDALQYFSASDTTHIKAIITRNVKDYKHSKIAVFTPSIYLKAM